jgi:hypothetical protein
MAILFNSVMTVVIRLFECFVWETQCGEERSFAVFFLFKKAAARAEVQGLGRWCGRLQTQPD